MLVSFSVQNFLSFSDKVELTMLPTASVKELPQNVAVATVNGRGGSKQELEILKSAVIFGQNAGGKSNLLFALKQFCNFVAKSHDNMEGTISVPFLLNHEKSKEPSEFEIRLLLNNVRYRFGFSVNEERVLEEWLFIADKGVERLLYTREYNQKTGADDYEYGPGQSKNFKMLEERVRPNALLLSVGAQFNIQEALNIREFLKKIKNSNAKKINVSDIPEAQLQAASLWLQYADIGVQAVEAASRKINFKAVLGNDLEERMKKDKKSKTLHKMMQLFIADMEETLQEQAQKTLNFIYLDKDNRRVHIALEQQSAGTLALLVTACNIMEQYQQGGVLLFDELESSLHPMICEALLKIIHEIAGDTLQFIMTTHNVSLLNADLFRRDQVWIMEKDRSGQSGLKNLADFVGIRKFAKLGKHYLEGAFGGLPLLDDRKIKKFVAALRAQQERESHPHE